MKQESMVGSSSQLPSTSRRCSLWRNGFHPFLIGYCLLVCMFCCSRMSNGGCVLCSLKNSASVVDEENNTEGVVSCFSFSGLMVRFHFHRPPRIIPSDRQHWRHQLNH